MEKFDKDLEEIKTELNNIKLSEDFKNNLKIKMEEELNKPDAKEKARNFLFPRKLVATFACFFLLVTSCAVFADEIESFVASIFSNTDRRIEKAIANGNYKEIDMEYVEHDGIGIKVDYVISDDDSFYIAFNILTEEEFDDMFFENIEVKNDKEIIHKIDVNSNVIINSNTRTFNKKINLTNNIYIYQIYMNNKIDNYGNIKMKIENICFSKNDKINKKLGNWLLEF